MKYIKWNILFITCVVCLLPILFGVAMWESLPDTMAIHFDINNNPDNFASKGFVVFGLPVIMAIFQVISCIATDLNSEKYGESKRFEVVSKFIITFITFALYIATLGFSLEWNVDIRKVAVIIVGVVFIATGICILNLNYVKNYRVEEEKAKKINKITGYGMAVSGILMLISSLLPAIYSMICFMLLFLFIIVVVIFSIIIVKK